VKVASPRRSRLRSRRFRASERGATLFVVVLVFTLLLGIGAFAARSAHLATASSGYARHQTQTRYVGEYAMMMTTTLLAGSGGQSYLKILGTPSDQCTGQSAAAMKMPSCYKMSYTDLQGLTGGINLCEPYNVAYPGSLGPAKAECFFYTELTDKMQGMTPSSFNMAGSAAGNALKFFYVTATTVAQVRLLNTGGTTLDAASAESSSTQTLRARILAGPYPAN
jgi:hypothetical protein